MLPMVLFAVLLFAIHVVAHIITWGMTPHFSNNGKHVYSLGNPSFITGVVMVLGFSLASYSGYYREKYFSFHVVLVIWACGAFLFHGYQQALGPPIGDHLILIVLLACALIYMAFNFFNHANEYDILHAECRGVPGKQLLLVVKYSGIEIPAGAYFNIYNTDSKWQLFHGHPFSVLCSPPGKLCFLIDVRRSFTKSLYESVMGGKYPIFFSLVFIYLF
jgi:hypothetical protein